MRRHRTNRNAVNHTIASWHNLNSDNCFISFAYLLVHAIYD